MHPLSHRRRLSSAEKWTSVSPCLAEYTNPTVGGLLNATFGNLTAGAYTRSHFSST